MTRFAIGEDIAVLRAGEEVELPPSRKTRALLAYLLLNDRAFRREHLCDLFWDRAADPRGGLRWALAKLRRVLGDDAEWLEAGRLKVELNVPPESIEIDRGVGDRLLSATVSDLHDDYSAWITAMAEDLCAGAEAEPSTEPSQTADPPTVMPRQTVRYTQSNDGAKIAYAEIGAGPPLLKAANWMTHLDAELEVPLWAGLYARLAQRHRLYRYDERGSGLSDWNVADISFDAFVRDLECVVDAIGLERFPLLGISQGGAVSIEYAARHPERVSALILVGAYPAGWRFHTDANFRRRREAEMMLVEEGWGDNSPAYRQIFSHTFLPDGSPEDIDLFNKFQRQTTSPANAARFIDCFGDIDVRHRLAEVRAPALVLHARDDQRIAPRVGAELAATLPDARFETLPTANHVPLAAEPAFERMMAAITDFLNAAPPG